MAKAVVKLIPPAPILPVVEQVVLTLTEAEAKVLLAIGWRIGGHTQRTRRGLYQGITDAISAAGIREGAPNDIDDGLTGGSMGSIYFKETSKVSAAPKTVGVYSNGC